MQYKLRKGAVIFFKEISAITKDEEDNGEPYSVWTTGGVRFILTATQYEDLMSNLRLFEERPDRSFSFYQVK